MNKVFKNHNVTDGTKCGIMADEDSDWKRYTVGRNSQCILGNNYVFLSSYYKDISLRDGITPNQWQIELRIPTTRGVLYSVISKTHTNSKKVNERVPTLKLAWYSNAVGYCSCGIPWVVFPYFFVISLLLVSFVRNVYH